jgi:hypothetical protein
LSKKIEIEITDNGNSDFNAGWLGYLLGMPEPVDGGESGEHAGWQTGADNPTVKTVRAVFTRMTNPEAQAFAIRVVPAKAAARE